MFMKTLTKKYLLFFLVLYALDRCTKLWALYTCTRQDWYITHWWSMILVWNRGMSWSLFANLPTQGVWVLTIILSSIVCAVAWYTMLRIKNCQPVWCELAVLAGACGNLVDRYRFGAVIDFIDLHLKSYHWPTFNVADILIVGGLVGISWQLIRGTYDGLD